MTVCECGHQRDTHDAAGRCQGGDDDGDGYFDRCYCNEYEERRPMPPGVSIQVGPGVHHDVEMPDGTRLRLPHPITMSGMGVIFIPYDLT